MNKKIDLSTQNVVTWCPGCLNFFLLEAVKKAISRIIDSGVKQEDIVIATGIGCHGKIFDYLNLGGIYALHGRVIPVCLGMKLGNPNLTVLGFAGDGDTYSEGMAHFIHAGRYNADITLVVHDNQSFSLTTGQATPTSQKGYVSKAEPLGEFNDPLNPIKLALSAGASFVARCNARDIMHTAEVLGKAIKHNGFSFVEIIQDCLVFNLQVNNKDKMMYRLENYDKTDIKKAMEKADEWNYNLKQGKIPIGIFYQKRNETLEEKWPQLKSLKEKKIGWWQAKRD